MTFTEPERCAICGHTDKRDLHYSLVHWREADPGMSYAHVSRCREVRACRARVQADGETWPLLDTKRTAA